MEHLRRLNKIVKDVLTEDASTRRGDIKLVTEVLKRSGVDISKPFAELAQSGQLKQIESITRVRRKVQSEHPELKDENVSALRAEREEVFREYAKKSV